MSLKIMLELSDDDLRHFRKAMRDTKKAAKALSIDEIAAAARELILATRAKKVPAFVSDRLDRLAALVDMLTDIEWKITGTDRDRIAATLAYFTEAEDLIPDEVPALGFLDDAIMIELVTRDLKHDIEAYADFCEFRAHHEARLKSNGEASDRPREAWLEDRRAVLHSRMRRRRRSGVTRYIWS
ncbi:MAG: YkvA family protein [Lysobacterales bacterium]